MLTAKVFFFLLFFFTSSSLNPKRRSAWTTWDSSYLREPESGTAATGAQTEIWFSFVPCLTLILTEFHDAYMLVSCSALWLHRSLSPGVIYPHKEEKTAWWKLLLWQKCCSVAFQDCLEKYSSPSAAALNCFWAGDLKKFRRHWESFWYC